MPQIPETIKVFLSCALGALIGDLIGLQAGHTPWWGALGLVAGCLVGYLAYEFNTVIAAVPVAWQRATSWRWRPDVPWWRAYGMLLLSLPGAILMYSLAAFGLIAFIIWACGAGFVVRDYSLLAFVSLGVTGALLVALSLVALGSSQRGNEHMAGVFRSIRPDRALVEVLRIGAICAVWLLGMVWSLCLGTCRAFPVAVRFFRELARAIHSEARLICLVDAGIGVLVGYYFGNALIGAFAGGILGVLNFELVSIRWWKLVPTSRSIFAYLS